MKQTALVDDNEAWREYYEAEFGVSGIPSSSAHPPMIFHLQLQDQIQRDRICLPPVFYHGNDSRISFGLIAVYDWSFIQR